MIIDFRKRPARAALHDVIDAATGENLNHLHIVYADDDEGLLRVIAIDDAGEFVLDDLGCQKVVEIERRIKIVPKEETQGAITVPRVVGGRRR